MQVMQVAKVAMGITMIRMRMRTSHILGGTIHSEMILQIEVGTRPIHLSIKVQTPLTAKVSACILTPSAGGVSESQKAWRRVKE